MSEGKDPPKRAPRAHTQAVPTPSSLTDPTPSPLTGSTPSPLTGSTTPPSTQADKLATLIIATPSGRASFFANPMRAIGRALPPPKYWNYTRRAEGADGGKAAKEDRSAPESRLLDKPGWPWNWYRPLRYRRERRALAEQVYDKIALEVAQHKLSASINTDSVFEEFFAPIVKVSQRSYAAIYTLSLLAFGVGVGLIVVGTVIGVHPPKGVDGTIVASIFGGSGAISALVAVFGMSVNGIQDATSDLARVRVVLTAFATQLGQLRSLYEGRSTEDAFKNLSAHTKDISELNNEIASAMAGAIAAMKDAAGGSSSSARGMGTTPSPTPSPTPTPSGP